MNKNDARKYVEKNKPTRGDLAKIVKAAVIDGVTGMSTVNPQFTKQQVLDMMLSAYPDATDTRRETGPGAVNVIREFLESDDVQPAS